MRGILLVFVLAGCDTLLGLDELHPADGAATSTPQLVAHFVAPASSETTDAIVFPVSLEVPADYCVVTLGLAGDGGTSPSVAAVTYSGEQLAQIGAIQGVTGTVDTTTVTAQWALAGTFQGSATITATLASPSRSTHVSALFFTGIDPQTPVRAFVSTSGTDTTSSLSVGSAPGDVVESITGQGAGIASPDAPPVIFVDNRSPGTSLDNAAGMVLAGVAGTTTVAWAYSAPDLYQTVAASLVPAQR